jgi:hypothetical protein
MNSFRSNTPILVVLGLILAAVGFFPATEAIRSKTAVPFAGAFPSPGYTARYCFSFIATSFHFNPMFSRLFFEASLGSFSTCAV